MHDDGPSASAMIIAIFFVGIAFLVGTAVGTRFVPDNSTIVKKYKELTLSYETLQCSHRGLALTTVKGITLCMNPETKALHKIDEKAD